MIKIEDKSNFKAYVFDKEKNIYYEEEPDEFDFQMLKEIENDPDCHEFISLEEVYKELGINIEDLKKGGD